MSQLHIGHNAPDLILPDHLGQQIILSEQWNLRPLVLLFLRHLG